MLNSWHIHGRLTRDVDLRYTSGEKNLAVARFTLAVQRNAKAGGAEFPQFIAYGKTAESIEKYFKKGSEIILGGKVITNTWVKEGETQYSGNVLLVETFDFCGKKAEDAGIAPENSFSDIAEGEELPF